MMLINRSFKHQPQQTTNTPHATHAPHPDLMDHSKSVTKFNLGGLFKKKVTTKRPSIDSITSEMDTVNILSGNSIAPNPNVKIIDSDDSKNYTTSPVHRDSTTSQILFLYPSYAPRTEEERYTSFTSDCISLQNSEMTSHLELEDNDEMSPADFEEDDSPSPFDPNFEEPIYDYKKGGYHPVNIGDIYKSGNFTYRIMRKLGWGHFSTVWLAKIIEAQNKPSEQVNSYVAMKIVKSSKNYFEAAEDEIKILKTLNEPLSGDLDEYMDEEFEGKKYIMKLHDDFLIHGPHGHHICMVFEALGENILHLIYKHKSQRLEQLKLKQSPSLMPINVVKTIVKQMFSSVDYMHHRGVIHTDLKPENVLVKYNGDIGQIVPSKSHRKRQLIMGSKPLQSVLDESILIKIADMGNATYSNLHFTNQIQTRQYRSPEIILKYKSWGASTDMWSLGCIIFELITGDYLFDPHDGNNFDKDEDHLAQIIELLGEFPDNDYLMDCKLTNKFFVKTPNGVELKNIPHLKFWGLEDVLVDKYKFDRNDVNVKLVSDLILKCLRYNLDERYDGKSLLSHPWFSENPTFDPEVLKNLPNNHEDIPGYTCTCE